MTPPPREPPRRPRHAPAAPFTKGASCERSATSSCVLRSSVWSRSRARVCPSRRSLRRARAPAGAVGWAPSRSRGPGGRSRLWAPSRALGRRRGGTKKGRVVAVSGGREGTEGDAPPVQGYRTLDTPFPSVHRAFARLLPAAWCLRDAANPPPLPRAPNR